MPRRPPIVRLAPALMPGHGDRQSVAEEEALSEVEERHGNPYPWSGFNYRSGRIRISTQKSAGRLNNG